jgi:hypothetical protein
MKLRFAVGRKGWVELFGRSEVDGVEEYWGLGLEGIRCWAFGIQVLELELNCIGCCRSGLRSALHRLD